MAFWGVEVKPGKPYVLTDDERGRLHVTQATLGSGISTKKSILQCEVGVKKPIYLCSLLPDKLETCPLNLEFEEDEKVTFSILGPQSVHLSGFFYGDESDDHSDGDDYDSDLYGSDAMGIGSGDEDDSMDYNSEDDDDYYSEDDLCCGGHSHSPVHKSGVKIEEIVDDEKLTNENGLSKQAKKKKSQSSMSDGNSDPVLDSEDEDGFPVPARDDKSDISKSKANLGETKSVKADAASVKNLKRKTGAVYQDEQPTRETELKNSSAQPDATENEVKQKKNKKKKVAQKLDSFQENEEPDSVGMEESPSTEVENDLKPSSEKKKEKKKKKQNKLQENAPTPSAEKKQTEKTESDLVKQEQGKAAKSKVRSFPNGLEIEEMVMGKPDGKRASPGKKVSVRYIGKLKKNGKTFDSNIGRAPFKFRLGIGEVIKGWDVGVNGMRIGDKRRLTIPPAMGYGAKGAPPAIPPNAWLVFDVELVDVN